MGGFPLRAFVCWYWQEGQYSKRGRIVPSGFHTHVLTRQMLRLFLQCCRLLATVGKQFTLWSQQLTKFQRVPLVWTPDSFKVPDLWRFPSSTEHRQLCRCLGTKTLGLFSHLFVQSLLLLNQWVFFFHFVIFLILKYSFFSFCFLPEFHWHLPFLLLSILIVQA